MTPKKRKRKKQAAATVNAITNSAQKYALLRMQTDVESVAFWTRSSTLTVKERESAAWLGATRAVATYDACKGASLRTWVQLKAKYAIEDEERREQRQRRRFGKSMGVFFNAPSTDGEEVVDEYTDARRARIRELVRTGLDMLDARTREILERVWYCGETQDEIARDFGFSQSWCSRLYRRGMAQLKEALIELMGGDGAPWLL